VGRHVDETTIVEAARLHDQLVRHRQVAVDTSAFGELTDGGLHDVGEAPHRHATPVDAIVGRAGREEVPVLHHVAEHRIGDVVGGESESAHS
jgi:hypothetical protein